MKYSLFCNRAATPVLDDAFMAGRPTPGGTHKPPWFFLCPAPPQYHELATLCQPGGLHQCQKFTEGGTSPGRPLAAHSFLLLLFVLLLRAADFLPPPGRHQQVPDWMEETRRNHKLRGIYGHEKVRTRLLLLLGALRFT